MSLSLWVGPRWVGPRLASASANAFGSGGFERYEGDMPDEVLTRALQAVREDLVLPPSSRREIEDSPTRSGDRALGRLLAGAVASAGASSAGNDAQRLWRYDSGLRQLLVVEALSALLELRAGASAAECRLSGSGIPILSLTAPTSAMWATEIEAVKRAAKRRRSQADEILSQIEATPVFFAAAMGITSTTHPNTVEMMSVVSHLVGRIIHPIKHAFAVPRPSDVDKSVGPAIGTPAHYSFPAGHAAFSFAQATFFSLMFKNAPAADLFRIAELVSDNRVVAGLHYPMDADGGIAVGLSLGFWLAQVQHDNGGKDRAALELAYVVSGDKGSITPAWSAATKIEACTEWAALVEKAKAEWGQ